MICPHCMGEFEELVSTCASCGSFVGYPNVRLAEESEEKQALNARYTQAIAVAVTEKSLAKLQDFELATKSSCAVVAMSALRLRAMAVSRNELYSNYDSAVRGQARRAASAGNDQRRRAVDGKLWGTAAAEIRYAALSLDGRGLKSYGDCFVKLGDRFISHRASVLQDNSFVYLKDVTFGEDPPLGYRSNWNERHKVAVAKCQRQIEGTTESAAFARILMKPADSRSEDEFIEVHIYGGFDFSAFESVVASNIPRTSEEKVILRIAKYYALAEGKGWIDD